MKTLHVKKGDKVKVIAGGDRGKESVVTLAIPSMNKVVVEGVNVRKKHVKATKPGTKGEIVEMSFPIDASNVKKI